MNEVSGAIARWLEQKRGTDRVSAAVLAALALGSGVAVFLLTTFLIYIVLSLVCGAFVHPVPWLALAALGLTAGFYARTMKSKPDNVELGLDPMGSWIIKDVCSFGPRLILAGSRQVRCCGELGEMNVTACARALAYLAAQNAATDWEELIRHCPQLPSQRLREQLSLLDGVLFFGENASRVTLMEPFRLRLRWMLGQEPSAGKPREPARPKPEPPPGSVPVNEPEKLSAYEILGLSSSASAVDIKLAYRKRVKECHPDLFAGMDQNAQALAERWTKALNAAYATLKPRRMGASPGSTPPR
jgi:DnaJ-domain-containing protein 1